MLIHLVVTFALIVLACVSVWAVWHRLGRPMPRYLLPMTAAVVAIGYGVYAEYSWGERTEATLPASFVVLQRIEDSSALSPWSLLIPRTVRLSTIDTAAVKRHPAYPELRLFEVMLFERYHPVRRVGQLVDCVAGRRADMMDGEGLAANGLPEDIRWRDAGMDDRIVAAACTSARTG